MGKDPLEQTGFAIRQRRARRGYLALAIIGVLLIVTQVLLNILPWFRYPISPWSMLVSAAIGFWGFHGLDPRNADAAGNFLVTSGTRIITAIRTGRRSTDVQVVTTDTQELPVPSTPPAKKPEDLSHD